MSLIAAGLYLRVLRERKGMTLADVASATRTSESQISRIEKGEQEPRSSLMLRIVRAVGGSMAHLETLLLNDSATAEDGKRYAEAWLQRIYEAAAEEAAAATDEEIEAEIARLDELIARLRGKPVIVERIIGYVQGLLDAGADTGQQTHADVPRRRRRRRPEQ